MGIDIFQLPGILLRRWLYVVVTAVICAGLAAAYVTVRKPVYLATTDILIDPQGLAASPADPNQNNVAASQDTGILESQLFVVQSHEVLNQVVDKLKLRDDRFLNPAGIADKEVAMNATVGALQKNMTVEREGQSFVMTLTVKHRDMAKAAEIANAIASIYLKRLHEARSDASTRASGAFELQAKDLAEKLRKAEEELETFKGKNNLISTGQQGLVIDQQVEGVNKQLIAARADLELKRANYNQVKTLTIGSIESGGIPEALASTSLSGMRGQYAQLAARADQLSTTLGTNHPQMKAVRSQVEGMRDVMEQELARIRGSMKGALERAEANTAALQRRLDTLTTSSLDTSEAGIKARALQSEVDALRALYKTFLTRASELGQRDTVNINNSRVISKAVASGGSSLVTKIIIVIAGGLFGIALGSGLAVGVEILSRMFGGREDIYEDEEEFAEPSAPTRAAPAKLPVIAYIPAIRQKPRAFQLSGRKFIESDEREWERKAQIGVSRTVDSLLQLSRPGQPSTVLFLSPDNDNPGSRIVTDVAGALHRLDKEVLYSDGDGRDGSAHVSASEAPLADLLKFTRLALESARRPKATTPTFSNFAGHKRKADFVIIDASGEEARHHLAELLEKANAILLVGDENDNGRRMEELVNSLAPWRDRMLGTVMFGRVA
ncbi:GumC family protein [Rhizobium sp. TH2]|uniref:GumC family protein n=1 Tax=Rhizobium sp. TH2 TaxID=2775403 RepID=UPI0021588D29|nr:GumC family protein [Rhizobium sp. TH2]UVC09629.1 GumC family protein [Rhizobium sp. TH2]